MATYIDNIVKFHSFSKSPVSGNTTLGGAVNPSGHTITTSQVRAQDIPAFLNSFQGTKEQALTWIESNYATPAHNDIVYYGGEFKAGFSTPKCLKYVSKTVDENGKLVDLTPQECQWQDFDITSAATLKNADEKEVIAVHQNCQTVFVDGTNNASTNSNRWSLFVKKSDGTILDHFVASTDKIVAGQPSLGYNALVLYNNAAIDEGELDANYIGNTFAGIVHLNKQYNEGDDAKFKVTCFEYIGEKLDSQVARISAAVFGAGGEGNEDVSLTQKVAANTAAISVLNGDAQTTGSVAKAVADAEGRVTVTTNALSDRIAQLEGIQHFSVVVIPDGETIPATPVENTIYLVKEEGVAEGTYIEYIAYKSGETVVTEKIGSTAIDLSGYTTDEEFAVLEGQVATLTGDAETEGSVAKALADAKDYTDTAIATELAEGGSIAQAIADAKEQAIANAKVTLTAGNGITIPNSGTQDTAFTISVDTEVIATKASVEEVSDAVTAVSETVASLETTLSTDISALDTRLTTAQGKVTELEEQVAALTTGDNSVDSKIQTAVDSITETTDAISEAVEGVKATADTAVQSASGDAYVSAEKEADTTNIKVTTNIEAIAAAVDDALVVEGTAVATAIADAATAGTNAAAGVKTDIEAKSLASESTGSDLVKVTTAGTVGTGMTTTVDTSALSEAIADSTNSLSTTAITEKTVSGAGISVTIKGTVGAPTIDGSISTASYTDGTWSNETNVVTGDTVKAAIKDVDDKINTLHSTAVTYKVFETKPEASEEHKGIIALVPAGEGDSAVAGSYIEWLCVESVAEDGSKSYSWERIGTTAADFSQFAKTADLKVDETTVNGLTYSQTNGLVSASVAKASTTQVGTVQLTDSYDATDSTNAATGTAIAAAIATLDTTAPVGEGAVKVSQTDGIVSSVTVETEALVSEGVIIDDTTSTTALVTAADALAAIKLAAPANYVTSINGSTGAQAFTIKDGRENVYANDLWGTTVNVADGVITVQGGPIDGTAWGPKNGYNTKGSASSYPQGSNPITKVEYNMVYNGADKVANIKTNELVNGSYMFTNTALTSFSGLLSSLVNGSYMFSYSSLESFNGDLSSLVNGRRMFSYSSLESFSENLSSLVNGSAMFCETSLTSFDGDLSSLVNGDNMFSATSLTSFSGDLSSLVNGFNMFFGTSLESFNGDLSSLVDGCDMFHNTSLTSFSGDLSSLVDGSNMFYNTSIASFSGDLSSLVDGSNMFFAAPLESFNGDLSSLVNGSNMFHAISLDVESVELICDVLPNYNIENGGKTLQTATWNESGENKGKYTYSDWSSGNYNYPIVKIEDASDAISQGNVDGIRKVFGTKFISESNVKTITIRWRDNSAILGEGYEAERTEIAKLFTDTAKEKGWTFIVNTEIAESGEIAPPNAIMATDGTIQYYVFAKKDEATADDATHIDASGKLWKLDTAEAIIGPNIKYWSLFATVENALTEWGLTPWTKPQETEEA